MRCEVPRRQSSGVSPAKRGPEADRFSSVPQLKLQWSMMTSRAATVDSPSWSPPPFLGRPNSPGRKRRCWITTSCVRTSVSAFTTVMPGLGAVWPAMVRKGWRISSGRPFMSITPPTSKTTVRGPGVSMAAFKEPGPSAARVVTRRIWPPLPPVVAVQPGVSMPPLLKRCAGGSRVLQAGSVRRGLSRAGTRRASSSDTVCANTQAPRSPTCVRSKRRWPGAASASSSAPAWPRGCTWAMLRACRSTRGTRRAAATARMASAQGWSWSSSWSPLNVRRVSGVSSTGTAPTARSSSTKRCRLAGYSVARSVERPGLPGWSLWPNCTSTCGGWGWGAWAFRRCSRASHRPSAR